MSMAKTLLGSENNTKKPQRRLDAELQTMARIDRMLAELEDKHAVQRVLHWISGKYSISWFVAPEPENADPQSSFAS